MVANPLKELRTTLAALLDGAAFDYDAGETRALVRRSQKVLEKTMPDVAHARAVGIFYWDHEAEAYVEASEEQAKDSQGNLRPGYEYLFRQPRELAAA